MGAGRIPTSFRVGVTGHRYVDHSDEEVRRTVGRFIDRVAGWLADSEKRTGVRMELTIVSSLAEGADQIVAEEVLKRPGSRLEAVLPFSPARYEDDFTDDAARQRLRSLLDEADSVRVLRGGQSEQRYAQAGQEIVERSDVLVAVWDGFETGKEAGTAATVSHARKLGRPVLWVTPAGNPQREEIGGEPKEITWEAVAPLTDDSLRDIARINRAAMKERRLADGALRIPPELTSGLSRATIDRATSWFGAYYARLDRLANASRQGYLWVSRPLFVFAAAAVIAAASELTVWRSRAATLLEVGLLAALFLTLQFGRGVRWHERWISSRFLAEWFRSALFLALVGTTEEREASVAGDTSDSWVRRAFVEVWLRRPALEFAPEHCPDLRELLASAWIDDQQRYYRRSACRERHLQRAALALTQGLFGLGVLVAIAHLLIEREGWENVLGFLTIVVPVTGAAIGAMSAQREYRRHAARYERMSEVLVDAASRMRDADTLAKVRKVARDTDLSLRREALDWFGIVRLQELELPF